jgi:hypothetical protein
VNGSFTVSGPLDGFTIKPDEVRMLLQNALEEQRLCYVKKGPVWAIIPSVEAATLAPHLALDELAEADSAQWAVVNVHLRHLDPVEATGALRNLTSRQGGLVNPVKPNTLLICDRVDRLREVVKTVQAMDEAATPVVKRYVLSEGLSAVAATEALQQLFSPAKDDPPTFAAAPSGGAVLARATPADQLEIAEAVAALK